MNDGVLICPVCGRNLYREGKSFFCSSPKRHCFDVSASGYVNLSPGRATGGDGKEAVRARTEFLSLGHYRPISDKICEMIGEIKGKTIIDAGCGEGYYTNNLALQTGASVYGFDLSKEAIMAASKQAGRQGISNLLFCVAGIYSLPVCDESADVITNIFAPCAEAEFCRTLKKGGSLVLVSAGKDHLMGLKRAIYDSVYPNEERADTPSQMTLVEKIELKYVIKLDNGGDIRNLFSMTPYSYRTSEKDHKKLLSLDRLETEVNVEIAVYRKEQDK